MNDDQRLLASAFLDDDVTAAERARVEADAEVLAEVERLRAVRREVATVEPPTPEARATAIAAALELFDQVHAGAPAARAGVTAPPAVHRPRRPSGGGWPRWLLPAAAALVAVTVGGVVALDDRDDDAELTSGAGAPAATTQLAATAMAAEDSETEAQAADAGAADEPDAAADVAPSETADSAAEATTAVLPLLRTPADLAAFARSAVPSTDDGVTQDRAACDHGDARGQARYLTANGEVTVDVYADPTAGTVTAAAAGTCDVVARATTSD